MAGGAGGARDLRVADVPDQQVPEAVLGLALHRGAAGGADELLARQLVQVPLHLGRAPGRPSRPARPAQKTLPTTAASWSRLFRSAGSVSSRAAISACTESGTSISTRLAPVGKQARELLRIEWVAARALEQRPLRLRRQHRPLEQDGDQAGGLLVAQRGEVDRVALRRPAAQARMLLVQLRAGGAKQKQRHPLRPVGQVLEERRAEPGRPSAGPRTRARRGRPRPALRRSAARP